MRLFLIFAFMTVWLFFARYYYFCHIKGECKAKVERNLDSLHLENRKQDLSLQAGDTTLLANMQQFYFDFASTAPLLSVDNRLFLKEIAKLAKQYPDAQIHITGYYLEKEAESLENRHQDLGLDRAAALIQRLRSEYEIPAGRLFPRSQKIQGDSLYQPLSFELVGLRFALVESDSSFLAQVQNSVEQVTYSDLSANFDSGSKIFQPGKDFSIYIDSLQQYFERNPKAYLQIIGHTDSKGQEAYNQKLGLERADAVRNYLKTQGIEARIEVRSMGETKLLAVDTLEDGSFDQTLMAKNRRVELSIQNK